MPESSAPSWLDPSMWDPQEVPCLDMWEKEPLSEEEPDEPHIVDGEPEEPQP
jgi:hypothetical protein